MSFRDGVLIVDLYCPACGRGYIHNDRIGVEKKCLVCDVVLNEIPLGKQVPVAQDNRIDWRASMAGGVR